jgi:hypothetical protein
VHTEENLQVSNQFIIGILSLKETGSMLKQKLQGIPWSSEENDECVWVLCVQSPKKSITHCILHLGIPKTMIQNVVHKQLKLRAYKIQMRSEIKDTVPPNS